MKSLVAKGAKFIFDQIWVTNMRGGGGGDIIYLTPYL